MEPRDTLLLVDDQQADRAVLRELFQEEYNLLEAENGDQALLLLEENHTRIAAVLLDLPMPAKDGFPVLAEMRAKRVLPETPVVVITAQDSAARAARAFELGASDFIVKPFEPCAVRRRVRNLVELSRYKRCLEELAEEQANALRQSNEVMVDTLSSIIEYRGAKSGRHILRIRRFTKLLLEELARSCPEYQLDGRKIAVISAAAALHDIGKIAIPDAILNKPGQLTPEEFEVMKTHSAIGCRMLEQLDGMGDREYLRYAWDICRYHHERWEGEGYPDGLRGERIPLWAQAVGLADAYEALTTDRGYQDACSHEQAMNMILNGACGSFSPKLLECFKHLRDAFAALACTYTDDPPAAGGGPLTPHDVSVPHAGGLDMLQTAQVKYLTLLRYVNATVVEVDLDQGVYHMVYDPNPDFALLRSGASFAESMRNLVQRAVHPDDRARVLEFLKNSGEEFFAKGLMKYRHRYRVYSAMIGDYRWYEATLLRIDVDDLHSRKGLAVWREAETAEAEDTRERETALRSLWSGVQCCRNDRWFTLMGVSENFSALVGYTPAELEQRFQNRLTGLILPEDRAEVRRRTREQLTLGSGVELEYRLVRKDGQVIWVLEKSRMVTEADGVEYLYCVLVDISRTKKAQEELRLSLERHQIILAQTNDIIFEWDVAGGTVSYSPNWKERFGYAPMTGGVGEAIPKASHIHPEDAPVFLDALRALMDGAHYEEMELRIAKADGRYLWCRIRATAQQREDGRPIKVVGVVMDIDGEKRANQALRDKAERDGLTRLLNKNSARRRIEAYLSEAEGERAALLIIDVDNFKQVNDSYGHMFGDAVLARLSEEIRGLFRADDIVSRIGGDEFLVFLKRVPDKELVEERCGRLIEAFQGMFQKELVSWSLSCSVGAALSPEHGAAFQELFQRADQALYRAKRRGKNCYELYRAQKDAGFQQPGAPLMAVGERIDSGGRPGTAEDGLVQYAFRRLYESGDVENTVQDILALVGRRFNVSRTYIFENTPDNRACRNTFEWCSEGVEPQIDRLQHIEYQRDLGGRYEENFDEHGVFYCPDVTRLPKCQYDILEAQDVKSLLQCAIRDNGVFRGYVGFDECVGSRLWTQEQIDALTHIAGFLSVFLLKLRSQQQAEERARDLRIALDNQNSWIYVIDPDTYEMLFINAKTRAVAAQAAEGLRCYQAFLHRDAPCGNCPARDIRRDVNRTVEFYNPVLDVWSLADASLIRWSGREACLISCHDITRYKKTCDPER